MNTGPCAIYDAAARHEYALLLYGHCPNGALFFWNLPEQLSTSFAECVPFSFLSDHESDSSMILSETLEEQCVARGERLYYNYNNLEFEVAQFYADGDFQYDSYASLSYALLQHGEAPLNASFHLDAGEYTDQVYQSLRRQIIASSSISEVSSYSQQEERSSFNVQNDRAYLIVILAVMGVLLILNLYHIVYFWLKNREKELFVHMLVGADWKKLRIRLLVQFGSLVLLSSAIGYAIAIFLMAQELLPLDFILRGNRAAFLLSLLLILCAAVFSALLLWLRTKSLLKRKWGV